MMNDLMITCTLEVISDEGLDKLREAHKRPSSLKESSMVDGERLNYLDHVEEESQGRLTDINSPVTL